MILKNRICVLYHYYEKDHDYIANLEHFLNFGLLDEADYFIIISEGKCTPDLNQYPKVRRIDTTNNNYDHGGYSQALKKIDFIEQYEYIFFVNSSVRGPYLPPYIGNKISWFDCFIAQFSPEVGLVGASINFLPEESPHSKNYERRTGEVPPFVHVQTPVFVLTNRTLEFLLEKKFFDTSYTWTRDEVISKYEIGMSRILLDAGWDIKCLLPEFNTFDFRQSNLAIGQSELFKGDVLFPGSYLGRTVHPYEIIFVKTARGLWPPSYLDSLARSMALTGNYDSSFINISLNEKVVKSNYQWFGPKNNFLTRTFRRVRRLLKL
jgi:hypothetical protein